MSAATWTYVLYLAISIGLTVWVARTLSRSGRLFLQDVFGKDDLADAVNHLLVVGFYLLNLGYVCLALRSDTRPSTVERAIEVVAWKVGLVLVVLGVMHFFNLFVFSRIRRGEVALSARAASSAPPPPLPVDGLGLPTVARDVRDPG